MIVRDEDRSPVGGRNGQIAALFALMLVVLIGMVALAIDVAHARSTAESAQRAADSGALAGVAFLPNTPDIAAQQAVQLSTENGFNCNPDPTKAITDTAILGAGNERYVFNCDSNTTITVDAYPGSDRLRETISTKVSTPFSAVVKRATLSVSRSATAEYQDPVQLGAPDNELGFAAYPTHAFDYFCSVTDLANQCENYHPTIYPQGFYLQLKGTYAGFENGDAFSPQFMTHRNGSNAENLVDNTAAKADIGSIANPCASPCADSTPPSHIVATNPYSNTENQTTGLHGYSFIFAIPGVVGNNPPTTTLLKIMDPLDECYYDGRQPGGNPLPAGSAYAQGGNASYPAVTAPNGSTLSQTFIDQCGGEAGNWLSAPPTQPTTLSSGAVQLYPTSLSFELYRPVFSLSSDFTVAMSGTDTIATDPLYNTGAYTMTLADKLAGVPVDGVQNAKLLKDTYGIQPLTLGPEFKLNLNAQGTACNTSVKDINNNFQCTGQHSFDWFTLASVVNASHSTAYVMLVVNSGVNLGNFRSTGLNAYKGTYSGGGNVFSLGACGNDATGDPNSIGNPTVDTEWLSAATQSSWVGDPAHDGCLSPGPGYTVTARQAMCIMTEQTGTNSYIPLATIPDHFAGNDLTLKLFDPGDVTVTGGATNNLGLMAPQDGGSTLKATAPCRTTQQTNACWTNSANWTIDHPVPMTVSEPYRLDISSASDSTYSWLGAHQRPPWWGTDYAASSFQDGNGSVYPAAGATTNVLLNVADSTANHGHDFANGTFLDFHIRLPADYPTQTGTYGNNWWKMFYQLTSGTAGDTTTWEVVSNSSPVHLTNG